MKIDVNDQAALLRWAGARVGTSLWPADSEALGVVDDNERLRAVAVLNGFFDDSCMVHFATDGSRSWATPNILGGLFGYAFIMKGLSRITGYTPASNTNALIFAIKLGFVFEGRQAKAFHGEDVIVSGMLREDCRWIRDRET